MIRVVFLVVGLFAVALGLLLLLAPRLYLSLYVPQFDSHMIFAAQRFSPVIAGLGGLLIWARSLPDVPLAKVAGLTALVWFCVAGTGLFHYATGVATTAILTASAIEAALGVLFGLAARRLRQA